MNKRQWISNILAGVGTVMGAGVLAFIPYYLTEMDREISRIFQPEYYNVIFDWLFEYSLAGPFAAWFNNKRSPKDELDAPVVSPVQPVSDIRPTPFFDDLPDFDIGPVDPPRPKKTAEQYAVVDMDQLLEDLERDEGVSHVIYRDSRGFNTAGIGHLLTKKDPEYSLPVGTKIGHERVIEWFEQDIDSALIGIIKLFPEFNSYPMEVRLVLTNMIFQLGYSGLSRFKKTRKFIESNQWAAAADEMMVSKWAEQTPYRAQRHSDRLKSISSVQHA